MPFESNILYEYQIRGEFQGQIVNFGLNERIIISDLSDFNIWFIISEIKYILEIAGSETERKIDVAKWST